MTYNDIIRGVKLCLSDSWDCYDCPFLNKEDGEKCFDNLLLNVYDLITRQKAEIERLKRCVKTEDEVRVIASETIQAGIKVIKAEAIKEFSERLKERIGLSELPTLIVKVYIDELVKEIAGESE